MMIRPTQAQVKPVLPARSKKAASEEAAWRLEKARLERQNDYLVHEIEAVNRAAADREKRFVVAMHEARQAQLATAAQLESVSLDYQRRIEALENGETLLNDLIEEARGQVLAVEADLQSALEREAAMNERLLEASSSEAAALERCDEHFARAEWAIDERARLAKMYEDACVMATHIDKSVADLEQFVQQALVDSDQQLLEKHEQVVALERRCEQMQTALEYVNRSIELARGENESLTPAAPSVEAGRFWRFKTFAQRTRRLVFR